MKIQTFIQESFTSLKEAIFDTFDLLVGIIKLAWYILCFIGFCYIALLALRFVVQIILA